MHEVGTLVATFGTAKTGVGLCPTPLGSTLLYHV